MAKGIPSGSHMNMYSVADGVGKNASLPSWKIRGFGYFSLGITEPSFFTT